MISLAASWPGVGKCLGCTLPGEKLVADLAAADGAYAANTQRAIDAQVFGAPWYRYRDEPFWGQDRLDFLDRALAEPS